MPIIHRFGTYVNAVDTIRQFARELSILGCAFRDIILVFSILHFDDIAIIVVIIAIVIGDIAVALLASFTPAGFFSILVSER